MKNYGKVVLVGRRCFCAVLVLLMAFGVAACSNEKQELQQAGTEGTASTVPVKTAYGELAFPEELYGNMRHAETTEGQVATEVFYMVSETGEKEVFRIHYADSQAGTPLGYLKTEDGEISVSHSICEYADESFADEAERELYYRMMDAFSVILNSIFEDSRFSESRPLASVEEQEVELRYWTVMLPGNVYYEEAVDGDNYRVDFYGKIGDERIELYTIGLGDLQGESVLGQYTVDGVPKPVVVQTGDMRAYELRPEEDQAIIYNMMASINGIIQTIAADENFSDTVPAT